MKTFFPYEGYEQWSPYCLGIGLTKVAPKAISRNGEGRSHGAKTGLIIVGPTVVLICSGVPSFSFPHVILMQISRQCRVDLVLEIDKDELWLFFGYSTTVVLLVNYGLSVSQTFPFLLCSLRCKKQRRHPPYPISWSYTQRYEKWRKERLWGFVSIKMQKALFHFQFHYFLD